MINNLITLVNNLKMIQDRKKWGKKNNSIGAIKYVSLKDENCVELVITSVENSQDSNMIGTKVLNN